MIEYKDDALHLFYDESKLAQYLFCEDIDDQPSERNDDNDIFDYSAIRGEWWN